MTNLGLGVMINMLGGNENSVKSFQASIGKKIVALELVNEELVFTFDDATKMKLFDGGQSCCEHRYMTTDDDLESFIGSTLTSAETREAPSVDDEHGETHEVQFLLVATSKGVFTMETHNEHNGYYGGFWVIAETLSN